MKPTYPYTVKSGDWLAKIAEEHGTSVGEIWNHPHNAEHRAKRGSPDVLYPGDVIHIPYEPELPPPPPSTPPPPPSLPSTPPEIPPFVPPALPPVVPPELPLPTLGAFALIVDTTPFSSFYVESFEGTEEISGTFRFEILAHVPTAGFEPIRDAMIGCRAAFVFSTNAHRVVRGVIAGARVVRPSVESSAHEVVFTLVPHLELLRYVRRSRIFQHTDVVQVATQVLAEAGVAVRASLTQTLPKRVYCTQFEETDLEFVQRILAEAGLFFAHEEPNLADVSVESLIGLAISGATLGDFASVAGETWVIGDSPLGYPTTTTPIDALVPGTTLSLPFIANEALGGNVGIWSLDREATIAPTAAAFRDYDPERPAVDYFAREQLTPPDGDLRRPSTPSGGTIELEHYDHHGPFLRPDWEYGVTEPRRMLRQLRRRADIARGVSNAPALSAGHRFMVNGHPLDDMNREYVLVRVEHRGSQSGILDGNRSYEARFECVPSSVVYCPPRPQRRAVNVTLTARVVGPPGEDVYVSPQGEVRVQFQWDRGGAGGETSSCWIRVMQAMAGNGWGTQFFPRVGTEVIVSFEGGDPDKPFVLGSLYNGTHPPPFALPSERTKSGFRSHSTPAASGYNELSFEDASGHEQVFLHAARDFVVETVANHTCTVGADLRVSIDGASRTKVAAGDALIVGKDREVLVRGNTTRLTQGAEQHIVEGSFDQRVTGPSTRRLQGKVHVYNDDDVEIQSFANVVERTHGHSITIVGREESPSAAYTHVEGRATLYASKRVEITSETEIVLSCGESSIRISPGQVDVVSPTVKTGNTNSQVVASDEGLQMRSEAADMRLSKEGVVARTKEGASMAMGREVKFDGSQILLNSPAEATDPEPPKPNSPTTIVVRDQTGAPVPHQRIIIRLSDGTEIPAALDEDGRAIVDVPVDDDEVSINFPGLHDIGED